ncbi:MAG TPA: hypothetical protein PKW50_07630 [Syntrophomonas sp.]|nr:hypothetical protein [Syntrophomonas sp.]
MNAVRDMYSKYNAPKVTVKKPDLTLVSNEDADKEYVIDGKRISKEYLNEKLAYFYENGGPVMDI